MKPADADAPTGTFAKFDRPREHSRQRAMGKSLSNPGREPGDTRKLGERVAAAIENEIMARGWPVGEVLGSEAHLIERFGVSRAVLREAVRIVESHHVARMRRGPNGGLIVSAPEMGAVQASAARFLDYADVSQEDLFVVRSVLELASIRQVIDRLDESIIAALRGALSEERILFAEHGITLHRPDIHVLIARLSGNPALWLFVDVLDNLTQHRTKRQVPRDLDLAEELHRTHTGIVEAIIAGDAPLAQHRMSRHLDAMSGFYR